MAKPKFELTADLVKVEPEPEAVTAQPKSDPIPTEPRKTVEDIHVETQAPVAVQNFDFAQKSQYYTPIRPHLHTLQPPVEQYKEEEREAISMKISKDLKKSFHLWCVQRGITMTDAIEAAIKKYLQE